ncbi:GGDEF domain-containing protein [Pseudoalteromonas citrea]|uniref:GGDEF domain-containing protein n=1 Tax=Pseudoalteromonas citrea TaxID=43655 RepID=UPI0014869131|nr:GGDEF domain-containing protein [Pseudoalteromonas citrea]
MFNFVGLKPTLISIAGVSVLFILATHFQVFITEASDSIHKAVYPVLAAVLLFSAQFNRSRISLLCGIWLIFVFNERHDAYWKAWVDTHQPWLIITLSLIFVVCALIKDRALLSFHLITRIAYLVLCGALSWYWLLHNDSLLLLLPDDLISEPIKALIPTLLPLLLCNVILLLLSVRSTDLTKSILLISSLLWSATAFELHEFAFDSIILVLAVLYLLVVCIESYFLAYRDELTNLPTRRALHQLALSLGRRYTIAMIDIDHFKKFNDTYGHDIGDQVLKLVASKLAKIKGGGRVFRYGGEEFTVIFARKGIEHAQEYLEVLREEVANYDMVIRDTSRSGKQARKSARSQSMKTVHVTVSIGVAEKSTKYRFEQVLKHADLALYRAKKRGRNNVCQ